VAAKKPAQRAKLSAFVSHAKAEAKKAQEIAASLEERGLKCWIAPRDVTAGRTYGDEIIRGIESAKAFVLVLSNGSNGSAFVAREVERAVSKQKPIFVIRLANIEPARPPLSCSSPARNGSTPFPGTSHPISAAWRICLARRARSSLPIHAVARTSRNGNRRDGFGPPLPPRRCSSPSAERSRSGRGMAIRFP
jgi:hypothetical protein